MRKLLLIVFLLVSCTLCFSQNTAEMYMQNPTLALNDARSAFSTGNYERAISLLKIYTSLSGKNDGNDLLSKAKQCQQLLEKAQLLEEQGDDSSARKYYSSILELNPTDVKARKVLDLEYADNGFIEITRVEFANVDNSSQFLSDFGATLYVDDVRFVKQKVYYKGISHEPKTIQLDMKIYGPDGKLKTGGNSPEGYCWSEKINISPGTNNFTLLGWGRENGGLYKVGTHLYEIWYNGKKLYSTTFDIKEKTNTLSRGEWRSQLAKVFDNATKTYVQDVYKGQLDGDTRDGFGAYRWNNDNDGNYSFFFGQYSKGQKNGISIYILKEGNVLKNCPGCVYFVGQYTNGGRNGKGACYDKLGNLIYYGNFESGVPTDNYPSSVQSEYKFECIEYSSGNRYIGETKNGKPHGEGIYLWSDFDAWFGQWSEGSRNGYGLYMYYSGNLLFGHWVGNTKTN